MADDKSIPKYNQSITHIPTAQQTETGSIHKKQKQPPISPITSAPLPSEASFTPTKELQGPPIEPGKIPTPNAKEVAKTLQNFAKTLEESIPVSAENVCALANMSAKAGFEKPPEKVLSEFRATLAARTPDENKDSVALALFETALDKNGKEFTPEFLSFIHNPQMPPLTGGSDDKKPFSFIALLLLLNELANLQQQQFAKLMQARQTEIETIHDEKKENISQKAWVEFGFSLASAAAPFVMGGVGWKQGATDIMGTMKMGEYLGQITQSAGKFGTSRYEMTASDLDKLMSTDQFSQQQGRTSFESNKSQASELNQAALRILSEDASLKSTFARNV